MADFLLQLFNISKVPFNLALMASSGFSKILQLISQAIQLLLLPLYLARCAFELQP
jgi:hypothetical protein